MTGVIYICTLIFLLMLIELLFAAFGVWLPLSLIGLHYLAYTREFKHRFAIAILFGIMIDSIFMRMVPCTMVCAALWSLFYLYNPYFKKTTLLQQTFLASIFTGVTVFLNLLPALPAAALDAMTFYSAFSIVAFAMLINTALTPLLFPFFDNVAVWLGIRVIFDPYLNHTSTRLREIHDDY